MLFLCRHRKDENYEKIISFALVIVLSCSVISFPATANTINTENENIAELIRFLSISEEGFLIFDELAAQKSGVSSERISYLNSRVEYMNSLVLDYGAYIDDSFSAVIYLPSARANGECKVVTYIHGLTEVYMDSEVADEILNYLSMVGNVATASGVLARLATFTKFKAVAGQLSDLATIVGGVALVYYWQIELAAAPGRGIVMSILDDGTTATPTVGYSPQ